MGLLGAVEDPIGLGSVAGWGIVAGGVARWKAWGQAAAFDVVFWLEVLNFDLGSLFLVLHWSSLLRLLLESYGKGQRKTAPRD